MDEMLMSRDSAMDVKALVEAPFKLKCKIKSYWVLIHLVMQMCISALKSHSVIKSLDIFFKTDCVSKVG